MKDKHARTVVYYQEKEQPLPSTVWYIMYSMALLNPDNLPDLGQGI